MANHSAKPPVSCRPAFWIEQEVDAWCHAAIKGVRWTPTGPPEKPNFIRKREVLRRTGLSHFSIWSMEKKGRFPKRVRLGEVADAAD
jgi:predicted DNA-binding transcriptional regulator AlpA